MDRSLKVTLCRLGSQITGRVEPAQVIEHWLTIKQSGTATSAILLERWNQFRLIVNHIECVGESHFR